MIKGIGTDIVAIDRIASVYQKHQQRFLDKLLTAAEQAEWANKEHNMFYLAGRWAAKESVGKALQCGISCGLTNIEILNASNGMPEVVLLGPASYIATQRGIKEILVSISHEQSYAVAFAIAEGW